MKRYLLRIIFVLMMPAFLQGCIFRPDPIRAVCNPDGDYIDLGRIAFTMQFDADWNYDWSQDSEIISVHYLKEGVSSAVNVASYTNEYSYFDIDWDKVESIDQFINEFLDSRVEGMKRHKFSLETSIVTVGPLTCVRSHKLQNIAEYQPYSPGGKRGGYQEGLSYYCPVPKQIGKLPIRVGISQSVGLGRTPHDLDALMLPILESMVIHPDPPENPIAIPKRTEQPY